MAAAQADLPLRAACCAVRTSRLICDHRPKGDGHRVQGADNMHRILNDYIRTIVDFPHAQSLFRDVTTLFAHVTKMPPAFRQGQRRWRRGDCS
jgi:hypothetical protein